MRFVDVLLAFPYLLLALIIVASLGPSLFHSMIAIGIVATPVYARIIRGQVLAVRTTEFVLAARAIGGSASRIMLRHAYFPFVEPGVEMGVDCFFCEGKGCSMCKGTGWIEVLGAGMHLGHLARLVPDKEHAVVEVEAAQPADAAAVRRKPDAVPSAA